MSLSTLPLLSLTDLGCAGQTAAVVLTEVRDGITDAEIAIQTVVAGVDAYFSSHPNPKLQGEIDNAVADVTTALRAVDAALAGATSIADGNLQAALTSFAAAYNALMALVGQISIQTAPAAIGKSARTPAGVLLVPSPRLLQLVKATPVAPAPAPTAAPAAAPATPAAPAKAPSK